MCEENKPQEEKVEGEIIKETPVVPEPAVVAPEQEAKPEGLPVEEKVIEEGAPEAAPIVGGFEAPEPEKVLEDKPEAPAQD